MLLQKSPARAGLFLYIIIVTQHLMRILANKSGLHYFMKNKASGVFILKNILFLIVFLYLHPAISFAQNSTNFIQYSQNTAITFALNTPTLLENTQTISNAFCLHLESASNTSHIYVKATASTTTTTPMATTLMALNYNSTTAPSAQYSSLNTADIPLTGTNQLLFIKAKNSTAYNFCYDAIIYAVGYTYLPGTYTFSLTFTMTQP